MERGENDLDLRIADLSLPSLIAARHQHDTVDSQNQDPTVCALEEAYVASNASLSASIEVEPSQQARQALKPKFLQQPVLIRLFSAL